MDEARRLTPKDWQEAIADTDGHQLVVAGPGTGKTEFLIRRIGHLVQHGLARPEEIVILSFSRRATGKLKGRIETYLESSSVPVDVTTFHSLALRLIESSGSGARPIPLTTPEQVATVRSLLRAEDPSSWPLPYRSILDSQPFAAEVADFFLRCSERLLTPSDLAQLASERADWRGLPSLYDTYLAHLSDIGRTDYGVLLTRAVAMLKTTDEPLHSFSYVLVDEYQDTSRAQAEMARLLALEGNLTVAGDPYQSIYSFRGAELRNIADFRTPGTKTWILNKSFRVPAEIMTPALRIVAGGDLPGSAGPVEPAPQPGSTEVFVFDQETAEAEWIANDIERSIRIEGISAGEIAVVVRSKKSLVSELSRALSRRDIDHDPPDSRLVDHPAVRVIQDVVAVATESVDSLLSSSESDAAIRRLFLGPLFGLSVGQERALARARRAEGARWADVLSRELPTAQGLLELVSNNEWAESMSAADGFWVLWTKLDGIDEIVESDTREEWRRAWTAFGQMLARQAERDPNVSLSRFFELVDEDDFEATPLISHKTTEDRVTLTTLHQVKGLEFDTVYIANAVEGVFPDLRRSRRMLRPELLSPRQTSDPPAQHLFQVQEEMRLAYTAMTRARRRVVWTATGAGVDQGEHRPSRFLVAAANGPVGLPERRDVEPTTVREVEIRLRRTLSDPGLPSAERLAAASVLSSSEDWDANSFAGIPEPGPDSPVLTDDIVLSPSQAESYARCPRLYVLERKLRLGQSGSMWSHFGDLCHEVLELAEGEVVGTERRHADLDRVYELVDEVWAERADFGFPELTVAWRAKAIEMFRKLYERWPGKGPPVSVEGEVESELAGVRWVGRVDRVEQGDEGLRVVDYKTGTSVPTEDEAAESIQLGFYAAAITERSGNVAASEMWFPRNKSQSVTTRGFAMHNLEDVRQRMEEITSQIVSENWEPRVGKHCGRCSFRTSCPAWPEGRGAFIS